MGCGGTGRGGHHSPSLCRVLPGKESPASQHPASSPSRCVCGCPKCVWLGRLQGKSAWWGSGLSGVFGAGLGCTGSRVLQALLIPNSVTNSVLADLLPAPVLGVCLQCESGMLQQKETEKSNDEHIFCSLLKHQQFLCQP